MSFQIIVAVKCVYVCDFVSLGPRVAKDFVKCSLLADEASLKKFPPCNVRVQCYSGLPEEKYKIKRILKVHVICM